MAIDPVIQSDLNALDAAVAKLKTDLAGVPPPPPPPPPPVGTIPNLAVKSVGSSSVLVSGGSIPGMADVRVWKLDSSGNPVGVPKYQGQQLPWPVPIATTDPLYKKLAPDFSTWSVEVNGLNGQTGLKVEIVDRTGPYFQPGPDMMMQPGAAINGHGAPSSVPVVLASATITATPSGVVVPGAWMQSYDGVTFSPTGNPCPPGEPAALEYVEFVSSADAVGNKVRAAFYLSDLSSPLNPGKNSVVWCDDRHVMVLLADSSGVTDASAVFDPMRSYDFTGKCLHFQYRCDAHYNSRRYHDIRLIPAGDVFLNPGDTPLFNGKWPSKSGNALRWTIGGVRGSMHLVDVWNAGISTDAVTSAWHFAGENDNNLPILPPNSPLIIDDDRMWDQNTSVPLANGNMCDVDKKHTFHLYVTKNQVRIQELDALGRIWGDSGPVSISLPFEQCEVRYIAQYYHSVLEAQELIANASAQYPAPDLWLKRMRVPNGTMGYAVWHMDDLGVEILAAMPV